MPPALVRNITILPFGAQLASRLVALVIKRNTKILARMARANSRDVFSYDPSHTRYLLHGLSENVVARQIT